MNSGLYVARYLTPRCAKKFVNWAKEQGFPNIVPEEKLHTTIVYSRKPIELSPDEGTLKISGGERTIEPLGNEGAVVLMFQSFKLKDRWEEAISEGASWDFPSFHSHITISYDAGNFDFSNIIPFSDDLEFQAEVHEPLNIDWAEDNGLRNK